MKRKKRRRTNRKNVLSVSMPAKRGNAKLARLLVMVVFGAFSVGAVGYGAHLAFRAVMDQAFYQNADFGISQIEVRVNGTISKHQVLRWSGVQKGENLIALNLCRVRSNLLRVPYIADVNVEKKLPDTLRITVEERQPIALLEPSLKGGYDVAQKFYYLDANGMVMKPKPGEKLKRLPVITGVKIDEVVEGAKIEHAGVLSALNFIRLTEMSTVRIDLDLTQVDVALEGYLRTRTHSGGAIRFRTDFLDQQLERLRVIFDYARDQQKIVRTVDLSPKRNVPVTFFN